MILTDSAFNAFITLDITKKLLTNLNFRYESNSKLLLIFAKRLKKQKLKAMLRLSF
jgi:hypothetical protein